MRVMAIDFGKKRLGLAISDERGLLAAPWRVLERQGLRRDVAEIVAAARSLRAERIVLGLPRTMQAAEPAADGAPGEVHGIHHEAALRAFAAALENALREANLAIDLAWWDERFSTAEALRQMRALGISSRQGKGSVDAHAAAVILQGYLDAQSAQAERAQEERAQTDEEEI